MMNSDQIIRTKLHLPVLRRLLVHRPLLKDRLSEGLRGPLTLVTAPAGFGKTTLAASTISDFNMPAAWLSLDDDDNQARRFLSHLAAALQEADEQIGKTAVELLAANSQPPPNAILTGIINDLETAVEDHVLVLDDYQFVRSKEVHNLVEFLLEHCPSKFHLMIVTRSDPPLPITRLRARGQLVELRAADLRFTEPEAAQFLNGVMGLNLAGPAVRVLEKRTEGWIAGLQLAALSLREREDRASFINDFSGSNRFILDYLIEEVLAGQPQKTREFLLVTSILERLTAPLCDFLLAMDDLSSPTEGAIWESAAVLERLDSTNIFLIPMDDQRVWYRYHHLFCDMLRAQLRVAEPGLIPLLHRRASNWLEQNGFHTEAVRHLIAAGENGRAADLVERYGPARLFEGDPSVLWMANRLPEDEILNRPKIGLYQAWMLIVQGQVGKARPLLVDLSRRLAAAGPESGSPWMRTIVSLALAFLSPPSSGKEADSIPEFDLLDEIPGEELILRNAADYLYVMALGRRGYLDRAAQVALTCIDREKGQRSTTAVPTLVPFLTRIYLMLGRLHLAAALCREYLDSISAQAVRAYYTAGSLMIDLGEVLYEWNLLEDAEQYVLDGLRGNELWHNIMTDGFGLVALTRILLAKGDFAGAAVAVEKFEKRMVEHSRPRELDEDFLTLKVRLQLTAGDLQNPSRWADQSHFDPGCQHREDQIRLTLARIRLAQQRYTEVENLLAGFHPPIASGNLISRRLESKLILAAAVAGQDRLAEALEIIESCLAAAEPEGYIRTFLDIGRPARELLAAHLRLPACSHKPYARKLLDVFSQSDGSRNPTELEGGLVIPLSERELEVLQLIAQGSTNKEIAGQLVIAPGTVKAHTASIYRKLDVANRTAAVARARQLQIL